MARGSVIFYDSFFNALDEIEEPESYREVVRAIRDYALLDKEPQIESSIGRAIFKSIRPQLDANNARYENSFKGGRPRKKPMVSDIIENKKPMVFIDAENQKANVNVNDNENVNVNDNDNEYVNENVYEDIKPAPRKKIKHTFGDYGHVRLTDDEIERLNTEYGADKTEQAIRYLDEYIQMKGYKAKDHNLAIRKWVFSAIEEKERKTVREIHKKEDLASKWGIV